MRESGVHPNAQKIEVKRLLSVTGILTTAQLTRAGLMRGAELLGCPQKVLTTMVRINDSSSHRDITYVANDARLLDLPPRDLSHAAAASELVRLRPLQPNEIYGQPRRVKNKRKNGRPDLLIWRVEKDYEAEVIVGRRKVTKKESQLKNMIAVEVDLGYPISKVMAKLHAIDAQQVEVTDPVTNKKRWARAYEGYIIATSVHSRVDDLAAAIYGAYMHPSGEVLQNLSWVEIIWVDFWSPVDRYGGRPNCHKGYRRLVTLM